MGDVLGGFEHRVLLAIMRLGSAGYTAPIVRELFDLYLGDISLLPTEFSERAESGDAAGRARVVADYVAGMTDRYAIAEHERLA